MVGIDESSISPLNVDAYDNAIWPGTPCPDRRLIRCTQFGCDQTCHGLNRCSANQSWFPRARSASLVNLTLYEELVMVKLVECRNKSKGGEMMNDFS